MKRSVLWCVWLLAWFAVGAVAQERGRDELFVEVHDKDAGKRRRAVRDLVAIGGRDAWELVIAALADPKGEVADEAQFQLARLDEPRLLIKLFGKQGLGSKDALLRVRVAEAFGRFELPLDGNDLVREMQRRDPALSETLLWSVERLAIRGMLDGDRAKCVRSLAKLVKGSGDAIVRCQAACALAALDPDALRPLLDKLLGAKAPELRRTALECALQVSPGEALDFGSRLRADESPRVRLMALECVASAGTKRSLELLLERLEQEARLRQRVACLEWLQMLSGRKHKLDPRHWRRWIESLPEDWQRTTTAAAPPSVDGTSSFGGLPILSDRVCFLIDFSGSLWYEREGRPARKGQVDELVRAALPRLGDGTRFNLIPYTKEPHPWRDGLVEASARNVRTAIADFEANTENGSGNVFDAVLLALQDETCDRIVILTDGAPTGGARWKLDLMVPLLIQATRFNGVALDAIVVDARPGLQKAWFRLARATGGRAVALDL